MGEKYNFSDFSDSEDDASDFKSTIDAIRKLDNHKQVLPAERSEPSFKVDEYHLTKEGDTSTVKLSELTRTLSKQPKHSKIAHDLKLAQKRTKTLPKPLEKPEAERISRSAGFKKVSEQLSVWDPVVLQNRLADHQVFPLPNPSDGVCTAEDLTASMVPETDLEKKMAEILKKNHPNPEKFEDEGSIFKLTLEEMVEKRKEAAKLRAQQSYMVAKARRQNKIKSKTYHRIARRERIRQQMKEFETLQQTNPEEALKRIEEIEKERALERVSLRHRNTGKWAKNQAVRAKYNKESRQILSEQLKLSRDLTKKVAIDSESSGEDDDIANNENVESDNPWVGGGSKTESEIDDFISGYRKFWDAKQNSDEVQKEDKEEEAKREVERKVADERAQRFLQSAIVAASASVLNEDDVKVSTAINEKLVGKQQEKADEAFSCCSRSPKKLSQGEKSKKNIEMVVKNSVDELIVTKYEKGQLTNVSPKKNSAANENGVQTKESLMRNSALPKTQEGQLKNDTPEKGSPVTEAVKPKKNAVKSKEKKLTGKAVKSEEKNLTGKAVQKPVQEVKKADKRKSDEVEVLCKRKRISSTERGLTLGKSKTGTSEPVSNAVNSKPEKMELVNSKSGKWTVTVKQKTKPVKKKADLKQKKREINSMFDKMNSKLQNKVDKKLRKLKKSLEEGGSEEKKKKKISSEEKVAKVDTPVGSSLRVNRHQRPDEDEGLDEQSKGQGLSTGITPETDEVADVPPRQVIGNSAAVPEIDPNDFMKTVRTVLDNAVPDIVANGDEGMDDEDTETANHLTISEAFADDDVVAEFEQEKADEIENNKPKDVDLSLPGWGSWGGHQVKPNERKRKRYVITAPEPAKRRDENKGNVYINEKAENKLKPQQVSELPFPFKSVKDYEASIGAPISNTFIPESAHRKLTLPRVITRTGAIIHPLSKDVLAERKKAAGKLKTPEMRKAVRS